MHLQSPYETLEMHIEGVANTLAYDQLDAEHAAWALGVAEDVLHKVFVRAGLSEA